jgi:hypothetical protein
LTGDGIHWLQILGRDCQQVNEQEKNFDMKIFHLKILNIAEIGEQQQVEQSYISGELG